MTQKPPSTSAHVWAVLCLVAFAQAQRQTTQYGSGTSSSGSNFGANSGNYYRPNDIPPYSIINNKEHVAMVTSGHTNHKVQQRPVQEQQDGIVDRFHHQYPDGSYEFRYELTDGTARYERGYFLLYDKIKTLVVVGYYSYRQTDGRYITVFYNADQNGYRQNQSITPQVYPNLPRTIEVPQLKYSNENNPNSAGNRNERVNYGV